MRLIRFMRFMRFIEKGYFCPVVLLLIVRANNERK